MSMLAAELISAQSRDLLATAERERHVTQILRLRRADRRAQRAAHRAAHASRRAADARLALG